jgi:plastocyanin
MKKRRGVALAVAICCAGAAAVGLTRAADAAPVTVPVSVGPSGMLVFSPVNVTAHQGDTVKWTWGSSGHTTTDASGLAQWDSGVKGVNSTFTHLFQHAGTYNYVCSIHAGFGMKGSVKVPLVVTKSGAKVTVRWASAVPPAGFVEDVQQRAPGATAFTAFALNSTLKSKTATLAAGTWGFRARYKNTMTGKFTAYSPIATVTIS